MSYNFLIDLDSLPKNASPLQVFFRISRYYKSSVPNKAIISTNNILEWFTAFTKFPYSQKMF